MIGSDERAPRWGYLTHEVPGVGGVVRATLDDFRVEELPAYAPSGEGEHLYVTFEKRGLTTPDAVRALAVALGVDPRGCGWAGLKDKHAVTVQTASFQGGDAERARSLAVPGVTVLEAKRHRNKLKVGHLHGNRFALRLRGCAPEAAARAALVRGALLERGAPNYYGVQRFGRDGDNAARALRWLRGEGPAPRDRFQRKMLASSLQSELFNDYVAARLRDGLLDRYVDGDLAARHPVGGPFPVDPSEGPGLYAARGASATGPMFGPSMRWPTGAAREREERTLREAGLEVAHFARAGAVAEGTRRAVRLVFDELLVRELPASDPSAGGVDLELVFALPAGGYATSVLREFRKTDAEGPKGSAGSTPDAAAHAAPNDDPGADEGDDA